MDGDRDALTGPRPLQAPGGRRGVPARFPRFPSPARPRGVETSRSGGSGGAVSYLRAARGAAGPGRAWRRAGREGGREGRGRGDAVGYLRPPAATAMEGEPMSRRQEPRRCRPGPLPAATASCPATAHLASRQAPRRRPRSRHASSGGQAGRTRK